MLNALILAAGESSRMKTDKAFVNYHGMPQFQHVAQLFKELNLTEIFVNGKEDVQYGNLPILIDSHPFMQSGPISGLYSAYLYNSHVDWFILAVDYPYLQKESLSQLISEYSASQKSVFFINPLTGIIEPIIGIYTQSVLSNLHSFLAHGNSSLRKFIQENDCIMLDHMNPVELTSVDYPV